MSGNAILLYREQQVFESSRGNVIVYMKLHQLPKPDPSQGLFLDQFVLSWTAFLAENPDDRVLVDCHEPYGIHIHINQEPRLSFEAKSIEDARSFFFDSVSKHFGLEI